MAFCRKVKVILKNTQGKIPISLRKIPPASFPPPSKDVPSLPFKSSAHPLGSVAVAPLCFSESLCEI